MSAPLPTHEIVAVFPVEIKAGLVHVPVRTPGGNRLFVCSPVLARGLAESLRDAGIVCDVPLAPPPQARPAKSLPVTRGRRGPAASRDYWRQMRRLRFDYDHAPRCYGSLRDLCRERGMNYRSVWGAFKAIRAGHAPYPDEEPTPLPQPIANPNGKLL